MSYFCYYKSKTCQFSQRLTVVEPLVGARLALQCVHLQETVHPCYYFIRLASVPFISFAGRLRLPVHVHILSNSRIGRLSVRRACGIQGELDKGALKCNSRKYIEAPWDWIFAVPKTQN